MKCPRCGFENQPDVKFCSNCGLSRQLPPQPINVQKEKNLDYNMPMNFHTFYAISTLVLAVLLFLGLVISSIIQNDVTMFSVYLWGIIFDIVMSILLLCRLKGGNIMRLISNIANIVKMAFLTMSSCCIFLLLGIWGISESPEIASTAADLILSGSLVGIILAVIGLSSIAYNIITMVYYHKRKHMFK